MTMKKCLVSDESKSENSQDYQPTHQHFKFTKWYNFNKSDLGLLKYSALLENMIRKPVREEVEQAVLRSGPSILRSLPSQAELSESRKLKLHFEGSLPGRLYAENKIEAEGPSPVKVVLLDALSHIITDGPLSSLKVEIVALHGHFKAEQLEDWNQKDFNDNIVLARDGKRPLLLGERVITLCNGVGFINGIWFTDNSSWERNKMFRLGARVFLAKEDQVREAVSSPFRVKDRRGEAYKKNNTLSLEDDMWHLQGIAKDGKICKKLAEHQIFKVKDFIRQYRADESLLCSNLGLKPKMWDAIVQQADLCLSSNVYMNPSDIPNVSISPCTIPSLPLHNFCVPAATQDQPYVPMAHNLGTEHNHLLEQSVPLNHEPIQQAPSVLFDDDSLMADLLAGTCDDGRNCSLHHPMALSSPTGPLYGQDMLNVPTPNWLIAQPIGEEDNGTFLGSGSNSHIATIPSFPNVGPSNSDINKPKGG